MGGTPSPLRRAVPPKLGSDDIGEIAQISRMYSKPIKAI
jgi:hypothetical protein